MPHTLEREVKLQVEDGFALPYLPGSPLPKRRLLSVYYDTSDHRLARVGITLRRRLEDGRNVWQLKLPRDPPARLEIEVAGTAAGPPPSLVDALAANLRGSELQEVARLRTNRSGVLVADADGSLAEVVLDWVSVLDGQRVVATFGEVEIESRTSDGHELSRLAAELARAGARPSDGRPKVLRALGLDFADAPPKPDAPIGAHLRAAFRAQLAEILVRDPALRLVKDPEDVHQLRVAVRRARAILRVARPVLDQAWSEPLRAELGWLGGVLGPARDLDVLLDRLRREAAGLEPTERRAVRPLLRQLERERDPLRETILDELRSQRYLDLLADLEAAGAEPHVLDESTSVVDLAAAEFKRLRKAVRALDPEPTDEELHEVRIRGKRARYSAELAERAAGKAVTQFIRAAKKFQDVVGDHQDAVVAEERLRSLAADSRSPRLLFAVGRLVELQRMRMAEARRAFGPAWKRLEKSGLRAWA